MQLRMKAAIFCAYVIAGLILADGRSLDYYRYEVEEGKDAGAKSPQPKSAVEERMHLDELESKAKEQLQKLKDLAKQYGFDVDDLKAKAEEQVKKFKEYAKSKGVDFDEMKEKLDVQINKFKEMAKEKGFDVDEMKEKAKGQIDKFIGKAKRLDSEKVKNWIKDKYNKVKEHGSKIMGREDSDFFDDLKNKAKDTLRNWFSKMLD